MHMNGQQSFFQAGRSISTFDYSNSEGVKLGNLQTVSNPFIMAGMRKEFNENSRFYYNYGLCYNEYGAIGHDEAFDNFYQYETNYVGLFGGLDWEFLRDRKLKMGLQTKVSPEFIIRGTQILNDKVYDLKGVEEFKGPILFFRGGLCMNYCVSSNIALMANYSFGKSIRLTPGNDTETLRYNSQEVGIGVLISLGKCRYCFTNYYK